MQKYVALKQMQFWCKVTLETISAQPEAKQIWKCILYLESS